MRRHPHDGPGIPAGASRPHWKTGRDAMLNLENLDDLEALDAPADPAAYGDAYSLAYGLPYRPGVVR